MSNATKTIQFPTAHATHERKYKNYEVLRLACGLHASESIRRELGISNSLWNRKRRAAPSEANHLATGVENVLDQMEKLMRAVHKHRPHGVAIIVFQVVQIWLELLAGTPQSPARVLQFRSRCGGATETQAADTTAAEQTRRRVA